MENLGKGFESSFGSGVDNLGSFEFRKICVNSGTSGKVLVLSEFGSLADPANIGTVADPAFIAFLFIGVVGFRLIGSFDLAAPVALSRAGAVPALLIKARHQEKVALLYQGDFSLGVLL